MPAFFTDRGGFRINDASAFISVYFRGSADDIARDKQVEDWLQEADTSPDAAVRKADYAKAIHRVTEQAYVLRPRLVRPRSVAGAGSSWRMRASCRGDRRLRRSLGHAVFPCGRRLVECLRIGVDGSGIVRRACIVMWAIHSSTCNSTRGIRCIWTSGSTLRSTPGPTSRCDLAWRCNSTSFPRPALPTSPATSRTLCARRRTPA